MLKIIAAVTSILLLFGCASPSPRGLSQVRVGMDKDQVLNLAGNPDHAFRIQSTDHWQYIYLVDSREWRREIIFENGHVNSITEARPKDAWEKDLEKSETMEEFEQKAREHEKNSSDKFKSLDGEPDDPPPGK